MTASRFVETELSENIEMPIATATETTITPSTMSMNCCCPTGWFLQSFEVVGE
jgi:hypothetical protein